MHKNTWLSHLEEQAIKAQFNHLITTDDIDTDIIPILQALNNIDGLVTLYSCQGHSNKNSYLVLRSSEDMCYFLEEAVWHLKEVYPTLNVEWNSFVLYNVCGKPKNLSCIILRNIGSYNYMKTLAEYFGE